MSDDTKKGSNLTRDLGIIVSVLILTAVGYTAVQSLSSSATNDHVHTPGAASQATSGMQGDDFMGSLPTDFRGLVGAGNGFMDEGRYAEAAEGYRRALEIDGTSPDVRTDFGACLHAMGLAERAVEEFRIVLKAHPEHLISRVNAGIVHLEMQNADSARTHWEAVLELNQEGPMAERVRELLGSLKN